MATFGKTISGFLSTLNAPELGDNIQVLSPYQDPEVKKAVESFFLKYFNDNAPRVFIIGINPGRFGGGLTGVAFTDPVALREFCGIENKSGDKRELSSKFIYSMIEAFGGVQEFYRRFYLTALFPLAIVNNGKNYNYYDDQDLFNHLKSSMVTYLQQQIKAGARRDIAICLGKRNFSFLEKVNKEEGFFDQIKVLEHPRYIMQYKLKSQGMYINQYLEVLKSC